MECKIITVSGMAFEAKCVRSAHLRAVYGLNSVTLAAQLEQSLTQGAKAVVSFGTAAGLNPSLAPGDIIIARRIWGKNRAYDADAALLEKLAAALPEAHLLDVAGVEQPLQSVEAKATLWGKTGAAMADMESSLAALLAKKHGAAFAAIRVVLDDAQCSLPPAALCCTTPGGTVNYGKLLASLAAHPQQLPALLRLASAQAKAKRSLARCGQLLGGLDLG